MLAVVATPDSEERWLARARGRTVRALEALIAEAGAVGAIGASVDSAAGDGVGADASGGDGAGADGAIGPAPAARAPLADAGARAPITGAVRAVLEECAEDDALVDGEPATRFRIRCPRWVRVRWRGAVELARRMAGEPLPLWQAAEAIAAEGASVGGVALVEQEGDAPEQDGRNAPEQDGCELLGDVRTPQRGASPAHAVGGATRHGATGRAATGCAMTGCAMTGCAMTGCAATGAAAAKCAATAATVTAAAAAADPAETRAVFGPLDWSAVEEAAPEDVAYLAWDAASLDAFTLDARLRAVVWVMQRIDWQTGRLLRPLVDFRLHLLLGFSSMPLYVRERLGLSPRKARALLMLDRTSVRVPALAAAYREGELSWLRALMLVPVMGASAAAAWLVRSREVTVRRLGDEIAAVLTARDVLGPAASLAPPPMGASLVWPVRQMCAPAGDAAPDAAHDASHAAAVPVYLEDALLDETAVLDEAAVVGAGAVPGAAAFRDEATGLDAEVHFTGSVSVVVLLESAIAAFTAPGEPRWRGFVQLLAHAIAEWERQPRHPDPVFARDGWRCAVPACSARGNLHDHHLRFRSRGGDNARDNRVTVCIGHHLRGIHAGHVRAWGKAPGAIHWELGVRPGHPPLLRLLGDRYLPAADGVPSREIEGAKEVHSA